MASKRERSTNWEREEKQLLRELMNPCIEIIENKNLCTNTNKAKLKAWSDITEKKRDKKQIMNQWKMTKLNSKKEFSKFRKELIKTGGGPRPPSPSSDTMQLVELLPQEFEVHYNEFDCDGLKDVATDDVTNIQNNNYEVEDNEEYCSPQQPTPMKTVKKTPMPRQKKFDLGQASHDDMHHFRVLENERQETEHELRVKHMIELQNQVMTNLKLQQDCLASIT